ncbi:MAG: O-antigen ligase family protein [Gammaproteobacteria bacterium]|nr:O-antigen ligase family protein [Gammaproteobacteria bacterium]
MKIFSYKEIWLYILPLLFLPNMGLAQETSFGLLQLNDFIIWPYIFTVYLSISKINNRVKLYNKELIYFLFLFLLWSIFSSLCATLFNDYSANELIFSMLKLAKLSLYAVASLLTITAISRNNINQQFNWSLLASLTVMSASLLFDRFIFYQESNSISDTIQFYTDNILSATMAILFSYLLGLLFTGYGSRWWQLTAKICLLLSIFGIALSNGRGGWIAILVSSIYIAYRLRMKQVIGFLSVCIVAIVTAYSIFPQFEDLVDRTIDPDPLYLAEYHSDLAGIETGGRWFYLKKEGIKVLDAPIFGTGFFHRGGETGLDPVGSHNFFVQMFLETGIIGGILAILVFFIMWKQAGRRMVVLNGGEIPTKAAISSAFVVGLSGEYFYGGMVLFTMLLSYGAVGRLPVNRMHDLKN